MIFLLKKQPLNKKVRILPIPGRLEDFIQKGVRIKLSFKNPFQIEFPLHLAAEKQS